MRPSHQNPNFGVIMLKTVMMIFEKKCLLTWNVYIHADIFKNVRTFASPMQLILTCREKNTRCYIHNVQSKMCVGFFNFIRKYMFTLGSCLGQTDMNICPLQSHTAGRLFHVRGTKDFAPYVPVELRSQSAHSLWQ